MVGWRRAMESGLYGPGGFFAGGGSGPAGHFRTSVHASPLFAGAVLGLIERVDAALGHPDPFDVVDLGAGRGELLIALRALLPPTSGAASRSGRVLGERVRFVGVEVAPRPAALAADIGWRRTVPDGVIGMLVATEWLDNVPLDLVEVDDRHGLRQVLVDAATGAETLGGPVDAANRLWLARWWPDIIGSDAGPLHGAGVGPLPGTGVEPLGAGAGPVPDTDAGAVPDTGAGPGPDTSAGPGLKAGSGMPSGTGEGLSAGRSATASGRPVVGARAEVGWTRDVAWADAVSSVRRGVALAVDYGHVRGSRPARGTLTGFRGGRQVGPVPDGSCDVTAHVAMDSAACAAGTAYTLMTQRVALRALGVDGGRPPLDLARADPARYLRALAAAGAAAELTDRAGLGGHWWLLHTIGIGPVLP